MDLAAKVLEAVFGAGGFSLAGLGFFGMASRQYFDQYSKARQQDAALTATHSRPGVI